MLPPAAMGSGESVADTPSAGAEFTVGVVAAPLTAWVSLLSRLYEPWVMTVPFASGLATRTIICTEPEAPAARLPRDHVTVEPDREPEAVAETNVVLAGTESERITPEASAFPVFA